jgi:protein-tyrosine-phosphatase
MPTVHIVFVCTANLCRSPMAEALLRARLLDGVRVSSMGIGAQAGLPPLDSCARACRELGIDISAHRSRPVVAGELLEATRVLVMEPTHREYLTTVLPALSPRIALAGSWPGADNPADAIADPVGKPRAAYVALAKCLQRHVARMAAVIAAMR